MYSKDIFLSHIVNLGLETPSFKNEWRFIEGGDGKINGLTVSFPALQSILRTTSSIPAELKKCFFEVLVIKGFKDEENGYLAIGLTTKDTMDPGADRNTVGYISIAGNGFVDQDGNDPKRVEGISEGDTIRCNVEIIRICDQTFTACTFFKSGKVISARRYINAKNMYPTIAVDGEGIEVETTFGTMKDSLPHGISNGNAYGRASN